MKRTTLSVADTLLVKEGNLVRFLGEDEYYYFPEILIELQHKDKHYHLINEGERAFPAFGRNAKREAEELVEKIRRHGSVDLSKWEEFKPHSYQASCESGELVGY